MAGNSSGPSWEDFLSAATPEQQQMRVNKVRSDTVDFTGGVAQ